MPVVVSIAFITGLRSLTAAQTPLVCPGVLQDVLKPTDAEWLTERFQVAADKRYHQLEKASEEQIPGGPTHHHVALHLRQALLCCTRKWHVNMTGLLWYDYLETASRLLHAYCWLSDLRQCSGRPTGEAAAGSQQCPCTARPWEPYRSSHAEFSANRFPGKLSLRKSHVIDCERFPLADHCLSSSGAIGDLYMNDPSLLPDMWIPHFK